MKLRARSGLGSSLMVLAIAWTTVLSTATAQGPAEPPAAPTAEQRARARELYGEGQRQFAAHAYAEALTAFQGAYEQVPNPVVLLGVASAQEQLGQRAESRVTLERYLRERADAPDRADIEARIAALPSPAVQAAEAPPVPTTGTVQVASTPAGAAITIDGVASGTTPSDLTLAPGDHEVRLALAGHEDSVQSVAIAAGATVDLAIDLVAVPAVTGADGEPTETSPEEGDATADEEPAVEEAPVSADPSVGVWVTTAIAGVALVTGTVFGFLALSRQSDFDAMPSRAAADEGESFALVADLSFGIAVAAGITAIVLYATERPAASTDAATARLLPFATPTGGGAVLSASF